MSAANGAPPYHPAEADGVPVRWFALDHFGEAIVELAGRPA